LKSISPPEAEPVPTPAKISRLPPALFVCPAVADPALINNLPPASSE